jgi:hypothetical protein
MLHGLLLEYCGTLLIVATLIFAHASPLIVGLAHVLTLSFADGKSEGLFSPLGLLVQYMLGRTTDINALKLLGAQFAAALSVFLIYTGKDLYIRSA